MNILLGEVNTEFASHPESRLMLPKSSVQIGGPLWKRHTPSYYLAELVAALRGAGRLKGKLGVGPAPDWFPTDKWSWRHFKNSSSGPIQRKTDICQAILSFWGFEPSTYHLETEEVGEGGAEQGSGLSVEVIVAGEELSHSLEGIYIVLM